MCVCVSLTQIREDVVLALLVISSWIFFSTAAMLVNIDAPCQRVLTQMSVAWQPFEDPETEVIRYFM